MSDIAESAIEGLNTFIEEQKGVPGEARLTVVLFNHGYSVSCEGVNIQDVRPFTKETYVPGGTTALLDAIGRAVADIKSRLAVTPEDERPEKIIVPILTDGLENASQDYTRDQVNALITEQRNVGWEFAFLAANMDAFQEGGSLGIDVSMMGNYVADAAGTKSAFRSTSNLVSSYRTTGTPDLRSNWSRGPSQSTGGEG